LGRGGLRIGQIKDDALPEDDDARMTKILDEYDPPAPSEVMDRHLADIAREREQSAVQSQQDGATP